MCTFLLLFNAILEVLRIVLEVARKQNEIKGTQFSKQGFKLTVNA